MSEQLSLLERVLVHEAREAGRQAGEAALAKARRVADFDAEGAGKFIAGWLCRHGPTSGEELVARATEHGYRAHDLRAMGPVFARLLRQGRIVVLRSDLPRARGHGTSGGKLYGVGHAG